jgi:hypothetical protein
MLKPRTHFEQVPLEIVKKIVEQEISTETVTERDPEARRQKVEEDLLGTKKKFSASSRGSSQREVSE